MNDFSEAGVIAQVRAHVRRCGSLRALSREWGVSPSYLCQVLDGRQSPGPKIIGKLGLERIVVYRDRAKL